jgi:hypothetical protein
LYGVSNFSDVFISGIWCINGRDASHQTGDGYGAFNQGFNNEFHRHTIYNCIFDTVESWGSSGVNPGALKFDGNVSREYLAIVNCTFRNFAGTTEINSGAPIHLMGFKYFLFDNNIGENLGTTSNGVTALVYYKHALTDGTTRRFEAIDNCKFFRGGVYCDDTSSNNEYDMANMELCYNNIENIDTGLSYLGLPGTIGPNDLGPHFVYRNTGENSRIGIGNSGASTIEVVGNVNTHTNTFTVSVADVDNYDDAIAENFNADNTLTDTYLTSISKERGTVGHEIE